jgi:two-component system, cell cycle response regulator DivK
MQTLLIVEDNELNREMLSRRLERVGYRIIVAVNGKEAVEKAISEKPHLILMDMSLPIMDGWEATRQIKAHEETKRIPVIALTAHALIEDLNSTLEAGCDDYDSKPIDFKRLLDKIQKYLPKKD